ncbi:MAG: PBP1A family penicillin-binding protein [Pseudomonadota bacterium]
MIYVARFFGFLFSWAVTGTIFVVLVLGGVLWSYGADLPDHEALARYEPDTLSRVYSGEGDLMDEFVRERRVFTPIDEIPDIVKHAFISAEDKNFYDHWGFDLRGMASAALDAAQGARLRGASTITQQVVKNFLLSGEREVERKIREILLAVRLEGVLEKDQILELYLNEIFLGQNSYGITAAAQNYFGKTLEELTAGEAAYLAALPKAPSNRHPVRDYDTAIFWRNNTLREMKENGYISVEAAEAAQEAPLLTVQSGDLQPTRGTLPGRDYFTSEIRRQLITQIGEEKLFTGGLTIRATVDPVLQDAAQAALRERLWGYELEQGRYRGPLAKIDPEALVSEVLWRRSLAEERLPRDIEGWHPAVVLAVGNSSIRIGIEGVEEDEDGHYLFIRDAQWARPVREDGSVGPRPSAPSDLFALGDVILTQAVLDEDGAFDHWGLRQVPELQGGFMVMDTQTGRVLALQGGFSFDASAFNRATQATRQPGSSFKPFVYAAALDQGFTPATMVMDAPFVYDPGPGQDTWIPKNYSGRFYGPSLMRVGIEQSLNLMTVRIADAVGMDTVADYAERFGIYDDMGPYLPLALGAGETTLYKMVAAYAMFANGGQRVDPTLVDRVQDRRGRTIYRHDQRICDGCAAPDFTGQAEPDVRSEAERIMSSVTAFQLIEMMEGVIDRGTARALSDIQVPLAGKTGTTNDNKDAWFIGFTPGIVAGCFIGFDNPRDIGYAGGTMCVPVFKDFIRAYLEHETGDPGRFKEPLDAVMVKVDPDTGMRLPDDATEAFEWQAFDPGSVPGVYEQITRVIGEGLTQGFDDLPATLGGGRDDAYVPPGSGGTAGTRPPPPPPPGGLDDGGLY